MKRILNSFVLFALAAGFAACSGSSDSPAPSGVVTISADKTEILGNGADRAQFTVMNGDVDITNDAYTRIMLVERNGETVNERQQSPIFGTREAGTYVFEARYTGSNPALVSQNRVTITATEADRPEEVFYRRILGQYFTSTGCHNCPQMMNTIHQLESQRPELAERLVIASFHTNMSPFTDPMLISETLSYMNDVFMTQGLPNFYLDVDPAMSCYNTLAYQTTVDNLERTLTDYPAACGVKLTSTYDEASRHGKVDVTVKASFANEYRLLAFLVEDGIEGTPGTAYEQQGASGTYIHENVVRHCFASSLVGERLGMIEADGEASLSLEFDVNSAWKAENMRVVVCVLEPAEGGSFRGNNAATTEGLNDTVDYAYNE